MMRPFVEAFVITLSLLCSLASGQVNAVINGPTEARVGDLVVLSGRDSIGDNAKWVEPTKIQTLLCGDGKDLAFATGTPGTYLFTLIVADKAADIDYATHTVIVRGGPIVEPPVPDPTPDPKPTPAPPALEQLVAVSKAGADRVNDAPTRAALAQTIRSVCDSIDHECREGRCITVQAAKELMVTAIDLRLLGRTGASRDADWERGWRVPVNAQLKLTSAADTPTYVAAMRAVALGLSR
jgi:hypothetical protein